MPIVLSSTAGYNLGLCYIAIVGRVPVAFLGRCDIMIVPMFWNGSFDGIINIVIPSDVRFCRNLFVSRGRKRREQFAGTRSWISAHALCDLISRRKEGSPACNDQQPLPHLWDAEARHAMDLQPDRVAARGELTNYRIQVVFMH